MSKKLTRMRLGDPIGESLTDWERLRDLTDEANDANIASDFDSWPLDDQARGYFFQILRASADRWTWAMVDREGQVVARAPTAYASWDEAEAATLPLKESLKAA